WLAGVVRGDLGASIEYGQPVTSLIAERLAAPPLLRGAALLINFTLGLWLGAVQAVRQGTPVDRWLTAASLAGYGTPSFWLGLVLAGLGAGRGGRLPAGG